MGTIPNIDKYSNLNRTFYKVSSTSIQSSPNKQKIKTFLILQWPAAPTTAADPMRRSSTTLNTTSKASQRTDINNYNL